jgi:hypothetical protein
LSSVLLVWRFLFVAMVILISSTGTEGYD